MFQAALVDRRGSTAVDKIRVGQIRFAIDGGTARSDSKGRIRFATIRADTLSVVA